MIKKVTAILASVSLFSGCVCQQLVPEEKPAPKEWTIISAGITNHVPLADEELAVWRRMVR